MTLWTVRLVNQIYLTFLFVAVERRDEIQRHWRILTT